MCTMCQPRTKTGSWLESNCAPSGTTLGFGSRIDVYFLAHAQTSHGLSILPRAPSLPTPQWASATKNRGDV
jgi:hypothetical protein